MSTVLERAAAFAAARLRLDAPGKPAAAVVGGARAPGAEARVEARGPTLRLIDLERRARFARIEADAPRGA
jgi:hypothetical protein